MPAGVFHFLLKMPENRVAGRPTSLFKTSICRPVTGITPSAGWSRR